MKSVIVLGALVGAAFASYCGDSSVPYSLEVLADGQPILGCGRPSCFGWAPSGAPASADGTFARINNREDGFMRQDPATVQPFGQEDPRYYREFTASCEAAFNSRSCSGVNQWVGGITPLLNVSAYATMLQCCSHNMLTQSEDRGVASVRPGQIVVGGEVTLNGAQIAFDYIADLTKNVAADGSVSYDVSIRRFSCPGSPSQQTVKAFKNGVGAQAFQVPNVPVDAALPLNEIEQGTLQEVQQLPGIQQPPQPQVFNQQPLGPQPQFQQFAPQPQFQQPFVPQQPAQQLYYYPPAQPAAGNYYGGSGGYGAGGGGAGAGFCFSGDMLVQTKDGETKRMDALEKKDWVLSMGTEGPEYNSVDFWLHRDTNVEADFHHFELANGKDIKLTALHYIYKGDCSHVGAGPLSASNLPTVAAFAQEVEEGDCLFSVNEDNTVEETRVVRSTMVKETGIYAPMTSSGKIIVNGVYASCHNIVQSHAIQHSYFAQMSKLAESLFGASETVDTPLGMATWLQVLEMVAPKNLVTLF